MKSRRAMFWGTNPAKQPWLAPSRKMHLPTISELEENNDFAAESRRYSVDENDVLLLFGESPQSRDKEEWIKDLLNGLHKKESDLSIRKTTKTQQNLPATVQFADFIPQQIKSIRGSQDIDARRFEIHNIKTLPKGKKEIWKTKDKKILSSWMQFFG